MKKNYLKKTLTILISIFALTIYSQTFNYSGLIVDYTVPSGVTIISIESTGAAGGVGTNTAAGIAGKGAQLEGFFSVTPGETLKILVGGEGESKDYVGGGGGGSFVWRNSTNELLIAAGGGGGGGYTDATTVTYDGIDASIANNGTHGNGLSDGGGTLGNGGTTASVVERASGGAGWLSNGSDGNNDHNCTDSTSGGLYPLNGGAGGNNGGETDFCGKGGFGGGGGANGRCGAIGGGGGGGYSGGGAGCELVSGEYGGGGGGGSFNGGTNPTSTAGVGSTNGHIVITAIVCDSLQLDVYDVTICSGESVILNATSTNGGTISWSNGITNNSAFTPAVGVNNYIATSSNGNDCDYSASIQVYDSIVLNAAITNASSGTNGAIDLSVTGGNSNYTFDWDNDGTGDFDDTEDLSSLANGTYSVVVNDGIGCYTSQTFILDGTIGINDFEESELQIFPNPSTGIVNIETSIKIDYIKIYDYTGKTVRIINGKTSQIDLSNVNKGIYFIEIANTEKKSIVKLMIK